MAGKNNQGNFHQLFYCMNIISQFPRESSNGSFKRQKSIFRSIIDEEGQYKQEKGRYHLYLSYACPWAHRTLIVRELKELDAVVSVSFVNPIRDDKGWCFESENNQYIDPLNGFSYLMEAYKIMDSKYDMRVTVPVLWDKQTEQIVNNESSDIIIMLNNDFNQYTNSKLDLYPEGMRIEIDEINQYIYTNINNGVYKCGFAANQEVYEGEVANLFNALDKIELRLAGRTYLVGDRLSLADIRLFVTLIRFDAVYFNHFKTNRQHIYEYTNLWNFVKLLYNNDQIKPTVKFDEIKDHYFKTHPSINPSGIVPVGPNIEKLLST
jgi:putative glutathione S-transferase